MDESSEKWLPVVGYEGRYEVSNYGRVRSLCWRGGSSLQQRDKSRSRPMRPQKSTTGYRYVTLHKDGSRRNKLIHQLVARAFIGLPSEDQEVRHLDGTRTNNRVENLMWGTRSENIYDAVAHGTHYMASREKCKTGHPLGGKNSDGKDRECLACRRASATVKYHKDLRPRFKDVADKHYENILSEGRRMLRADFL